MNIGSWLLRVIAWDCALPVAIWSVPFLIHLVLPNNRSAIEFAAVVLPIAAFLFRFYVGRRYITSNACGQNFRRFQLAIFCLGIFVLVLIDAVMVLSHLMPKGALFARNEQLITWSVLYGTYVAAMVIAMYPGSVTTREDETIDKNWHEIIRTEFE